MARVAQRSDLAERPVLSGEVLFDHFPDGSEVLGGAPFNVAWHLQGLGASPLLLSRVGEDELGDRVHRSMTEWGLDTSALQRDAELPTGTVRVVDTVGAGHAFAAVLLLAGLKNWSLALALERAQAFAAAIVGVRGATVLDRLFYQQFCSAGRLE